MIIVVSPLRTINSTMCQICKANDHIVITCPCIGDLKPKCVKCGLPQKMENCGMKCGYYFGMGHIKDKCQKHGKDGKMPTIAINYLEVLVDDEEATLE